LDLYKKTIDWYRKKILLGLLNISLNIGGPTVSTIIQAVIGAVVVIFVAGFFKGR
jgi:uncharacterized membrane protein YeaQ/YmgE (transglycosylase-associated protein family)